ncbi:P-loop containing nucleoside triphosphate hydrolase protein [Lichtheimia hyalospora FSU 10163]|nr:P-loop containing nucleoside triphosphate hydrolase protein [Lichtheimia hyalospora FSU 10163]
MSAMDIDPPENPVVKNKGKGRMVGTGSPDSDHLPWVEKYRPKNLDDLVSQGNITSTLDTFIEENQLPHLLFYGPPGTGKTSAILACARKLYGDNYKSMVLELNASDDRGIDVVREQIKSFASTRTIFNSGFKLIVLDEADSMTNQAQAALRRVIEKYTKNVRFCIICNYVSKIIPAIQSRCTRFRFAPLKLDQVEGRLEKVVRSEGVNLTEDGKKALIQLSKGDMRRVLNILQACHSAYERVDSAAIYNCTGQPHPEDIERVANWLLTENDFNKAYSSIGNLQRDMGLSLQDIISEVYNYILGIDLPAVTYQHLLEQLAELEYRLAEGANEKIQLGALLGAFKTGIKKAATA